jgi:hypothetical protein
MSIYRVSLQPGTLADDILEKRFAAEDGGVSIYWEG